MTEQSVIHGTFVIRRSYDTSPADVFAAWAEPEAKARWFQAPNEGTTEYGLDFRIDGREFSRGRDPNGGSYAYEAVYRDIVQDRRIVYGYDMHLEGKRISVSLLTVDLTPDGAGTRLTLTEQGAFLDGHTPARRERGTGELLDALGREIRRAKAAGSRDIRS